MSDAMFPDVEATVEPTDPADLKRRIDAGEPVTILDTRTEADYEEWRIDGPSVTSVNVPYYEFFEGLTEELEARVPTDEPLVAVCAKGEASQFVAELLVDAGYEATNLADGMQGWARLYEHTDVTLPTGTVIRQYRRPSSGCLGYLVVSDGEAAVVDPLRAFVDRYRDDAAELDATITHVLDTHVHADHVSGLRELAAEADATAVLPEPAIDRGVTYGDDVLAVSDGDEIAVGDATVRALHTPGHTSGMTTYVVDDAIALVGDTLFLDSVARPDLEEGDEGAPEAAAQLYDTLHDRILALPDDTLVGAAHYGESTPARDDGAYLATLGDLRADLDLLGVDREEFVERVLADMPPRPANYETIIATNLGQEEADDDEAFEMELGPNNCAAEGAA